MRSDLKRIRFEQVQRQLLMLLAHSAKSSQQHLLEALSGLNALGVAETTFYGRQVASGRLHPWCRFVIAVWMMHQVVGHSKCRLFTCKSTRAVITTWQSCQQKCTKQRWFVRPKQSEGHTICARYASLRFVCKQQLCCRSCCCIQSVWSRDMQPLRHPWYKACMRTC